MKYVKLFESNVVKDYFHDKIDWKFFNYLLSKLTKYEDIGIECYLSVIVITPDAMDVDISAGSRYCYTLYKYYTDIMDNGWYNYSNYLNDYKRCYKEDGLFYYIEMNSYLDSYINDIKSKCGYIENFTGEIGPNINTYKLLKPL